jgi:hypothetical protein
MMAKFLKLYTGSVAVSRSTSRFRSWHSASSSVKAFWHALWCGPKEDARLGGVGFCNGCGACFVGGVYEGEGTNLVYWFPLGISDNDD